MEIALMIITAALLVIWFIEVVFHLSTVQAEVSKWQDVLKENSPNPKEIRDRPYFVAVRSLEIQSSLINCVSHLFGAAGFFVAAARIGFVVIAATDKRTQVSVEQVIGAMGWETPVLLAIACAAFAYGCREVHRFREWLEA